jgi:hypothetical protein
MYLSQCPLCDHVNPTGSRFCNACGAPLHLAPCRDCGAINDVGQPACRECGRTLAPAPLRQESHAPLRSDPHAPLRARPAPSSTRERGTHLFVMALAAAIAVVALYGLYLHATLEEPRAMSSVSAAPLAVPPAAASGGATAPDAPSVHATTVAQPSAGPAAHATPAAAAAVPSPAQQPRRAGSDAARDIADCAPPIAALGLCGNGRRRE